MPENPTPLHSEIAHLETQLAEKKRELAQAGIEQPESLIFKQVLREHASSEGPKMVNYSSQAAPQVPTAAQKPLSKSDEAELERLLNHAFSKGVAAAVSEAKKTKSPYFIDALHDYLADEYYQKLLAARKINPN